MNTYKCPACDKLQYSASKDKGDEPCLYCGNDGTEILSEPVQTEEMQEAIEYHQEAQRGM